MSYPRNGHITDESKGRSGTREDHIIAIATNNDSVDYDINVRQLFVSAALERKVVDRQSIGASSAKSTADPGNRIEGVFALRDAEISSIEGDIRKDLLDTRIRLELDLTTSGCNGSNKVCGDNQLARNGFDGAFSNVQSTSYMYTIISSKKLQAKKSFRIHNFVMQPRSFAR